MDAFCFASLNLSSVVLQDSLRFDSLCIMLVNLMLGQAIFYYFNNNIVISDIAYGQICILYLKHRVIMLICTYGQICSFTFYICVDVQNVILFLYHISVIRLLSTWMLVVSFTATPDPSNLSCSRKLTFLCQGWGVLHVSQNPRGVISPWLAQ